MFWKWPTLHVMCVTCVCVCFLSGVQQSQSSGAWQHSGTILLHQDEIDANKARGAHQVLGIQGERPISAHCWYSPRWLMGVATARGRKRFSSRGCMLVGAGTSDKCYRDHHLFTNGSIQWLSFIFGHFQYKSRLFERHCSFLSQALHSADTLWPRCDVSVHSAGAAAAARRSHWG